MKNRPILLVMLTLLMPFAMWGQKTLPYDYGFENNDLAAEEWTKLSSSSNTNIATVAKRTGDYGFRFYRSPDPQYLISPLMPSTTNGLSVVFYYKNSSSIYPKSFRVGYSTTGTGVSDFTFGDEITTTDIQWMLFSQTFSANTKYIAIKYVFNDSYSNLYLDDFSFEAYSDYPQPKNLVVTTYTSNSATLDWTPRTGQDHWDIYYTTSTTAPNGNTTPSISNSTTKPYIITGLESGVTYHAYVRGNYNNGEHFSDWSNACAFEVGCFTPTIGQSMATCNQAYFAWTPVGTETSWQVAFSDQQGFDPDAVTLETVTTHYFVKENLTTGVTYYARVRAVCGAGDYSDWSDEVSMTTECIAPTNLHESSVTPNTVTLTWTKGSNETQWELSYSTTESFNPENRAKVTVNSNTYTLENLTLNTVYYAYVRAICGENVTSNWSEICSFKPSYTITVNDGTNYNNYVPVYGSQVSGNTKSQFIIPSDVLSNVENATIEKIVLYSYIYANRDWGAATFDVCLKEVEDATFSSTAMDWSDTTRVYYGSVSVSDSQMEISFKKSYTYHGGNLLVGFSQTASGTANTSYWLGANTTSNTALVSYGTSSTFVQFLPKITFYYTPGETPTCIKPNNLTASSITSNSVVLTWDAGDGNNWNVQYRASSSSEWTSAGSVSTPTCALSGLDAATRYIARVQTQCEGDDVSSWKTVSFTTECGPVSLPYSHNFDNDEIGSNAGLPQCWTKINDANADYPYVMGSNAHSGSNCLFFYRLASYYGENQLAVLPEMATDIRLLQLSFYARLGSGTNKPLAVGVMTDPNDASTFSKIEDVTIASNVYAQYIVSFDAYTGNGYFIAFKCEPDEYDMTQYYVDDVNVTTNGICFAPENPQISDVTANSAVITWTPDGSTTNWQVQYKKTTDADWSEPIAVNGTPSYTFSNLDATTTYQARVRTDCGNDNYSDWVDAENFITDCGFVTLPYSHDFDDDATGHVAPTCWHFSDGTYPYIYESSSAHSGNHYLQIKKNTDYASTLVLPAIDTDENPINTLKLTFWARSSQSTYYYEYLYAGVMTDPDDMTTFHSVQGATTNLSTTTYKQFEFYFDNWTGEGNYIALRYGGSTTYYIDDIEISVAPTCRQPLELSSNTTYAHEAYIKWKTTNANQLDYQVSYSTTEGFNPDNGTIVDVHFDSPLSGTMYRDYQLTNLNAETTYYFYVRTKCEENTYSDWSADYSSFTTELACPAPYINDIHPKHTVADINWYGDEDDEWEFQYKESSSEEWITPTDFSTLMGAELSLVYRLTGLTPNTQYDIRLRQHCGVSSNPDVDDGYSAWSTSYFTTGFGCWSGTPWMCTSHLGTRAALNWRNDAEDTQWQIRYRLASEEEYPAENIVTTDVLPEASMQKYVVTGLKPNSTYYWEVRGYCDENSQSEWSSENYFFTHSTDGYITVDKTHPYYEDFEDGMPEDWGRMNLYNYDMEHYDTWECVNATSNTWETLPASKCISSCREHMSWASPGSMILMPAIHIDENATSAVLSFWSKDAYNASDARGTKMIWVNGNYLSTDYTAFDLGCVYQKNSKAGYWRQCFVNLDDYIGQTVIIAFDYVVTHNYNNYDWWVDDVRVEVFDNVFGGGSGVTEGSWDDPNMWVGNSKSSNLPTADDNVLISAKVTIPEDFVAEANRIVLNLDTIADVKYGNIFIADGGQLKVNEEVEVTMERAVNAYTRGGNGWCLIALPVQEALKPESDSITDVLENNYDLYSFDGSYPREEWRNYKQHQDDFVFENGFGYLYANSASVSPSFKGTVLPSNQTKTVDLSFATTTFGGWNLVGNPFTCDAYFQDGRDFYRMNEGGTALVLASGVIHPMEGVFVEADNEGQSAVFTITEPSRGQGVIFSLRKAELTREGALTGSTTLDRTRIRFGEGQNLGHLDLMADPNRLYFPMSGKDMAVVSSQPVGVLPLNFEAAKDGTYTLSFDAATEGLLYCHLIDNKTGADVDLLAGASTGSATYTFSAKVDDYASRFKVVFVAKDEDGAATGSETFAFNNNGNWIIANEGRATLQVVDLNGRILSSEQIEGSAETRIDAVPGLYLIRLINGENVKVQKVVVR